jgi:hypothetical protein
MWIFWTKRFLRVNHLQAKSYPLLLVDLHGMDGKGLLTRECLRAAKTGGIEGVQQRKVMGDRWHWGPSDAGASSGNQALILLLCRRWEAWARVLTGRRQRSLAWYAVAVGGDDVGPWNPGQKLRWVEATIEEKGIGNRLARALAEKGEGKGFFTAVESVYL